MLETQVLPNHCTQCPREKVCFLQFLLVIFTDSSLKYYAEEVKKRLQQEAEQAKENSFLHSSLRRSHRLKAIEKGSKEIGKTPTEKKAEINQAFVADDDDKKQSQPAGTFRTHYR